MEALGRRPAVEGTDDRKLGLIYRYDVPLLVEVATYWVIRFRRSIHSTSASGGEAGSRPVACGRGRIKMFPYL